MKNIITILTVLFSMQAYAQTGCKPINDNSFQTELKKIKTHDFDEAKKEAISTLINSKCFSSKQIKQLLKTLSFEDDKLELAKNAFAKVSDPNNYSVVNEVFDFDDSKKALAEFIKK